MFVFIDWIAWMDENKPNYSFIAKFFHWGFVVFFIYGVFKAVEDLEQLEDSSFLRFEVLFALAFAFLLLLRFLYMRRTQKTSLPEDTVKIQKIGAKIVHLGMYITLFIIAITGLLIGLLFRLGLKDGLIIEMVIAIHEFCIPVMYWLIGIHVIAATYHRFLKDGVWNSMVPFWKERN